MKDHKAKTKTWLYCGKITGGVLLGWSFWFCLLIIALRWINPPFTAFVLQEDWDSLGKERYSFRGTWIPDDELPDHLKLAVIASEDQNFNKHWGLDLAAIEKAVEENQQGRRIRGASTITQQVAKNLFLSSSQNYLRKGIEAVIAVLIDAFWSKERILEVYLNIAEFGPGMYGIAVATDFYYGKPASELTPKEAARMVTVLPNPKLIEPEPPSEYVLNRSDWILRNMEQLSGLRFLPKKDTLTNISSIASDSLENVELMILNDSIDLDSLYLFKPDSILADSTADTLGLR
ncbi:MAG: monofunctional biosynthetic peptidoglycan transglycosylase [Gracilimonas sp.]